MKRIDKAAVSYKLKRIRSGAAPRVLDLFAGCGGLSLGFHSAGFRISAAVESDPLAAQSHATNLHRAGHPNGQAHSAARDITKVEPNELIRELHLGQPTTAVDVIIGGPPCQAFARVGRAKLREVSAHPEAYRQDPRSNLYLRFLQYVRELMPVAVLMENVPDALNHGGHNIAEETADALSNMGYRCSYTLLNSVFYGVPQMRERMYLIAYAQTVAGEVEFPDPTHWIKLPRGYEGTRQVALQTVKSSLFSPEEYYQETPAPTPSLKPAVVARQALQDLAKITCHLDGRLKRGARRFDQLSVYPGRSRLSEYANMMRSWPGFEANRGVYDHVIRSLPRDYAIFCRMRPGDQYPEAHDLARRMLKERINALSRKGTNVQTGTAKYRELVKATVPPYDPGKFPNKWRKMEADRPARTLTAHIGKDTYSHIHYDHSQARTISVREAARLQSFPDGFVFVGTMNPAFRQIGNAVPPLMAKAIADTMLSTLRGN